MHVLPLKRDVSSIALMLAHGYALHISPVIRLVSNYSMSFGWLAFSGGAALQSLSGIISDSPVLSHLM